MGNATAQVGDAFPPHLEKAAIASFDPAAIRRSMRTQRAALTQQAQSEHALAASQHFMANHRLRRLQHIAVYSPSRGELDPAPLQQRLVTLNRTVYWPVISGNAVKFGAIGNRWKKNRFGIAEPQLPLSALKTARQLQAIVLPLLAFDSAGHRLGMGGGYYDRTLAFRLRTNSRRPLLIGFAHHFQQQPMLLKQPWDVDLDAIITERGLHWFHRN